MADLTTTAAVKAYLAITTANQDSLIASLIGRASRAIERWTGRVFPAVEHTLKGLNGTGTKAIVLPDTPILDVSQLVVSGANVPLVASAAGAGFMHDDNAIYLTAGSKFPEGKQNVACSWNAGYSAVQTAFIPTGNAPTITPSEGGRAAVNVSVADVAGAAFAEVGATPAADQFTFNTSSGVYAFSATDSGRQVTMTYRYVPADVEQACIEMVGLDLKQRDNLGITSKSLAGESITYTDKGMTGSVRELLGPFRRKAPV